MQLRSFQVYIKFASFLLSICTVNVNILRLSLFQALTTIKLTMTCLLLLAEGQL